MRVLFVNKKILFVNKFVCQNLNFFPKRAYKKCLSFPLETIDISINIKYSKNFILEYNRINLGYIDLLI